MAWEGQTVKSEVLQFCTSSFAILSELYHLTETPLSHLEDHDIHEVPIKINLDIRWELSTLTNMKSYRNNETLQLTALVCKRPQVN